MLSRTSRRETRFPAKRLEKLHSRIYEEMDTSRLETWKKLPTKRIQHIEEVCRELMTEYGYQPYCRERRTVSWFDKFEYKVKSRILGLRKRMKKRFGKIPNRG